MPVAPDVCLEELVAGTNLYSGADLENLCKEVMESISQVSDQNTNVRMFLFLRSSRYVKTLFVLQAALLALEENMEASSIKHVHFLQSLKKTKPSLTVQQIQTYQIASCKKM